MSREKQTPHLPKMQHHRASGRAVVRLDGKDIYLGEWGTKETKAAYNRAIAEWLAGSPAQDENLTVVEVCAAYIAHLEAAHASHTLVRAARDGVRDLCVLYGKTLAADFGPRKLNAVRQILLDRGLRQNTLNHHLGHIKQAFRRACALESIPPGIWEGLNSLPPLRRGEAKPPREVLPVSPEHILAVRPFVSASVWAAIEVLRLTAARPGEILPLCAADIDRSGQIWEYRPKEHKTAHHGRSRVIFFGPEAQAVLKPFVLRRRADEPLFSPHDRIEELSAAAETHRRPNQKPNPRQTDRVLGDCYTPMTFARAIARACSAAGIPLWTPYRLRHTAATEIRKRFGLEAAQSVLGHANAKTTEIYAAVDQDRARKVIAEIG